MTSEDMKNFTAALDVDIFPINSSTNNTPSQGKATQTNVADAAFDKHLRIVFLYIIIILGLVGGTLVLLWLYQNRRRKSRVNALILNVTLSDLVVILWACVFQLVWEYFDRVWLAGNVACKILKWLQGFALMSSTNQLVVLSVDRMQAIIFPLRRPIDVWKMVGVGWLTAAVLSMPQLYVFSTNFVEDESSRFFNMTLCETIFRNVTKIHRQAYLTYVGLAVFYIPLIIICFCYVAIFVKISKRANVDGRRNSRPRSGKVHLQSTGSSSLPKAKIKTLKMTVVIVGSFILCSIPYHVLEMIYSYGNHQSISGTVAAVIGSMAVANSATNPFVFLLFNVNMQCLRGLCQTTNKQRTYLDALNSTKSEYVTNTTHTEVTVAPGKFQQYQGSHIELKSPSQKQMYQRISNEENRPEK